MEGLVAGRIVYFTHSEHSAEQACKEGNRVRAGDVEPAMVVKVWDEASGCVNLKVHRDGPSDLWVTSVLYSETPAPNTWHWMYSGQATRGTSK